MKSRLRFDQRDRLLMLYWVALAAVPVALGALFATLGAVGYGLMMLIAWMAPSWALRNFAILIVLGPGCLAVVCFGLRRLVRWCRSPEADGSAQLLGVARGAMNRKR